nr:hypothetical protein [Micromonospora humida]
MAKPSVTAPMTCAAMNRVRKPARVQRGWEPAGSGGHRRRADDHSQGETGGEKPGPAERNRQVGGDAGKDAGEDELRGSLGEDRDGEQIEEDGHERTFRSKDVMGGRWVALPVLRMRRNSCDVAADRVGAARQRRDWGIWGYREAGSPDQSAWGELTSRGYQTGPSSLVSAHRQHAQVIWAVRPAVPPVRVPHR